MELAQNALSHTLNVTLQFVHLSVFLPFSLSVCQFVGLGMGPLVVGPQFKCSSGPYIGGPIEGPSASLARIYFSACGK